MQAWMNNYKTYLTNKKFLLNVLLSFCFIIVGLIVNFYSGLYATEKASNSVTDLILSNTRVRDVDSIFIYSSFILWIIVITICLIDPKKIPFTAKSIALFILIRSVFISVTHIGPFPDQLIVNPLSLLNYFSFGGDLFFSGHTGLPFLLCLIYWNNKILKIFFLLSSLFFGSIVLLAHLHYTIDVLAAFFITYTIFKISELLFKKDFTLLNKGLL